jgi:signal peptidase II
MPPSTIQKFKHYQLLFITAIVVFALDQATKAWIFHNLKLGSYYPPEAITIIDDFFYIVHIGNEGAAWGMLSGYSGLLSMIALAALLLIYKFRIRLELHRRSMQWAFGLLIGGILGNLIDRLIHGHVIDFLDFHFPFTIPVVMPTGRYPSFNIADCGIVIGTIFYAILSLRTPIPTTKENRPKTET